MEPPITTIMTDPLEQISSPRSRAIVEAWDEPLPAIPNVKLRLLCSYGGRILPRPHDKSLCYVGGQTRIVVVDRQASLSDLTSRLSRGLLEGRRNFSLKYQLPTEGLDSLVSITTDEDLHNMIDEYDHIAASSSLSRLRLFLFLNKPETAASMGPLLDSKSETWFVDALKAVSLLPRGLSDTAAATDCLLGLDSASNNDFEAQPEKAAAATVVDNTSSFGSSSSSQSMSNLPPIRVRTEGVGVGVGLQEQRAGGAEERSDHGQGSVSRKPPLPLQLLQHKPNDGLNLPSSPDSKHSCGCSFPSLDSVASDSSIVSATSLSRTIYHPQDPAPAAHLDNITAPPYHVNPSCNAPDSAARLQAPQQALQDPSYILPRSRSDQYQQNQHHLANPTAHFVPQQATASINTVSMPSYYPVYAPPQPADKQYPYYLVPVPQSQPHNPATLGQPLMTPSAPAVAMSAVYKETHQPIYSSMAAPTYKTGTTSRAYHVSPVAQAPTPATVIQVHSDQLWRQYGEIPQISYASQSTAAAPGTATYAYEHANVNPQHEQQGYYTQHPPTAAQLPPSQYQTMTPAAAVTLPEASMLQQRPTDNEKQQIRASQPLQ